MSIRKMHVVFAGLGALVALGVASVAQAESVSMLRSIAFKEGSFVRPEVVNECQIQTRIPEFVQSFAKGGGVDVALVDALPSRGRVLEVEVVESLEMGNAFTGREIGLVIAGELKENGKVVGSFRARRTTRGGMWGGYKGSCGFFSRCTKTLGKDVGAWLANPTMNAMLGK